MSNIHIIIIIISYSLPYFITLFIGPAGILHDEIILTVTSGFSMWRSAAPVTQSRDETRAFAMAHRAQASPPPPSLSYYHCFLYLKSAQTCAPSRATPSVAKTGTWDGDGDGHALSPQDACICLAKTQPPVHPHACSYLSAAAHSPAGAHSP